MTPASRIIHPDCPHLDERVIPSSDTDAAAGRVVMSWTKTIWFLSMLTLWGIGSWLDFSWAAVGIFFVTIIITLCGGHSLGMHRLFIHRSFDCPRWLYLLGVWLGTIVGLGGPMTMMRVHDERDWAQRQVQCHDFPAQSRSWPVDCLWQIFGRWDNPRAPDFRYPDYVITDPAIILMQRWAFAMQLPLAIPLYLWGGLGFLAWGIGARVVISIIGHWAVGWFAHHADRHADYVQPGAAVQGRNVPITALITFGEGWHSNHHAFPWSAKIGLHPGQKDPGWWVLKALEAIGLVWNIRAYAAADPCAYEFASDS